MAKAADVVVQCLENEGVQYVFGIPGEENLDLLESLRKSQIRLVLTRHEQSAGFMAATYGRLTGKTGVSLSTLGPGATNLVTAGSTGRGRPGREGCGANGGKRGGHAVTLDSGG